MTSNIDLNVAWSSDLEGNDDINQDEALGASMGSEFLLDPNLQTEFQQEFQQPINHSNQMETEQQVPPTNQNTSTKKRLNSEQRANILFWLLSKANEGCLQKGSINAAAQHFNMSRRSVSRLWNTIKKQRDANERFNLAPQFHNSGRKRIEVPVDAIKALNMGERSCIRDLAANINVSKSTVHRMIKRRDIKPHSNSLHPALNEANKLKRLEWILSLLRGNTAETKEEYYPMYDFVHLDEKWFYLSKKSHKVYLTQNEKGKYRSASSSKFLPKVMFTAVVARPRFDIEGQCTFDGKIGIFPFTYQEPAKRSSKNRPKGSVVTKIVESVNQRVTRHMLINDIIPAIKTKWPASEGPKLIFIQQDNAKAHITQSDAEWQQIYVQDEFTFILVQQPPNSPDLNILDLGFFRSIQSLMHKKMPKHVDKMLEAVNEAFYELEAKTLSNVWMSLQYVMNEILKVKGGNEYALPHVNKKRLEAQGNLRGEIKAPTWAVIQAWDIIQNGPQENQGETTENAVQQTEPATTDTQQQTTQ